MKLSFMKFRIHLPELNNHPNVTVPDYEDLKIVIRKFKWI